MELNKLFKTWNVNLEGSKFESLSKIWVDESMDSESVWILVFSFLNSNPCFEDKITDFFNINNAFEIYSQVPKPNFINIVDKLAQLKIEDITISFKFFEGEENRIYCSRSNKLPLVKKVFEIDPSFLKNPNAELISQMIIEFSSKNLSRIFEIFLNLNNSKENPNIKFLSIPSHMGYLNLLITIETQVVAKDHKLLESKEFLRYKELSNEIQ